MLSMSSIPCFNRVSTQKPEPVAPWKKGDLAAIRTGRLTDFVELIGDPVMPGPGEQDTMVRVRIGDGPVRDVNVDDLFERRI